MEMDVAGRDGGQVTVSAVLPILEVNERLGGVIDSVLEQTFKDWELLVVAGLDESERLEEIMDRHAMGDERIRLITTEETLSLAEMLNLGIKEARGKYLARISLYAVSAPERFEKQVEFLESYPQVGICETKQRCYSVGSWIQGSSPHSTLMMRRSLLELHGFEYRYEEPLTDLAFLLEALPYASLGTLPEVLSIQRGYGSLGERLGDEPLFPEEVSGEQEKLAYLLETMAFFQRIDEWNRENFILPRKVLGELLLGRFMDMYREVAMGFGVFELFYHIFAKFELNLEHSFYDNLARIMQSVCRIGLENQNIAQVFGQFMGIPAGSRIIFYGLGAAYHRVFAKWSADGLLDRYQIVGAMDAKAKSKSFPMISFGELKNTDYDYILVSSGKYFHDIKKRLMEEGGVREDKVGMIDQLWLTMAELPAPAGDKVLVKSLA